MAFEFAYYINGSTDARILRPVVIVDTLVIVEGQMIEMTSQEADHGASASTTLIGVSAEAVDNTDDGESLRIIDGYGAVFAVDDATERFPGDPLDIGADYISIAANNDSDLVVVGYSTATEKTMVMISPQKHIFYTAT